MVEKMKRSTLTAAFIKNWFNSHNTLKIVCKKELKFPDNEHASFIKGYAYILKNYESNTNEFYAINSHGEKHWIYKTGKKNKFFHKYFDIARM